MGGGRPAACGGGGGGGRPAACGGGGPFPHLHDATQHSGGGGSRDPDGEPSGPPPAKRLHRKRARPPLPLRCRPILTLSLSCTSLHVRYFLLPLRVFLPSSSAFRDFPFSLLAPSFPPSIIFSLALYFPPFIFPYFPSLPPLPFPIPLPLHFPFPFPLPLSPSLLSVSIVPPAAPWSLSPPPLPVKQTEHHPPRPPPLLISTALEFSHTHQAAADQGNSVTRHRSTPRSMCVGCVRMH